MMEMPRTGAALARVMASEPDLGTRGAAGSICLIPLGGVQTGPGRGPVCCARTDRQHGGRGELA
jgi:hypothetical protein